MSIFGKIKDAIFGHAQAAQAAPASTPSPQASEATAQATAPAATPAPLTASPAPQAAPSASAAAAVDVAPILDAAVKKSGQKLDWKHSIVDMMKALGMDASLAERKELAGELGYSGDTNDSATMNVWLHKALMKKLAENGGNVPAELLD